MDGSRAPELSEVLRDAVENGIMEVHTAIPCKVVKYDAVAQTVDVKPVVQRAYRDEEDERRVEALPVIPHLPVNFHGGGGYRVTYPIAAGDFGMVVFFECSVDKWLMGDGTEVDPQIDHHHALMDGCFVPGVRPKGAALSSHPTDEMTMGKDDGVQIHCEAGTITIGDKTGAQYVALSEKVQNYLTALSSAIDGWTPVPNDGGAALKVALASAGIIGGTWGSDVAASQVKAK